MATTRLQAIRNGEENFELLTKITNVLGNSTIAVGGKEFELYKTKINELMTETLNLTQDVADYYMNKALENLKTWVCPVTGKKAKI